jgi:hypothetical protein
MRRAAALAAVLALTAGAALTYAQTPSAAPPAARTPRKAATPRPPLDFTGVWELDPKASRGAAKQMEGAVLSVRQNGNRIWIAPAESRGSRLLAETIVVDGQVYEKSLGAKQKGTLVAQWSADKTMLTLEAVAGTDANPRAAVQRMIWRLEDGGKTWTRQTHTVQPSGEKESFLVFRKRTGKTGSPKPTPTPKPPAAKP